MKTLILLLLVCLTPNAHAQLAAPDTAAGRVLSAWLESFNSADAATMRAFDERFWPGGPKQEGMLEISKETGGFELVRIEKSEPLSLTVLVQAKKESSPFSLVRFALKVRDLPTPTIHTAILRPAADRMSESDALAALAQQIEASAKADESSGVVIVARNGTVLFERAFGSADREREISNSLETQFRLGSMNKMFTAIAVLQLVEAGTLSLDDSLAKHLPDYPNRDLASKVTLRHLLTHTGGTGDIFGDEFDRHRLTLRTHSDYVSLFGARALQFEPGSKFRYSNYGFVLLGAVIEAVSGLSYYEYVEQKIFRPTAMNSTASLPESTEVPMRAMGYLKSYGKWVSNSDTLPWRGTAAGGGYSTAGDLMRFAEALGSGRLIPKALLAEATRAQEGDYGYGFTTYGDGSSKGYGHGGGAEGMNGEFRVFPNNGYVLIGLSNFDPPAASRLVDFFEMRMPESRAED